jgi:hypothetical protein
MAGLALNGQKSEAGKTKPIATAFKKAKKLASEPQEGGSSFPQFLTRFFYGEVASQSHQNTI